MAGAGVRIYGRGWKVECMKIFHKLIVVQSHATFFWFIKTLKKGPLLFLIYINDLACALQSTKVTIYVC